MALVGVFGAHITRSAEVRISKFAVGLIALVTVAATGFILRRRHAVASRAGQTGGAVDALYAAGL